MPKPKLNFVWIGAPRIDKGGHDIIGPESIDRNFQHFSPEERNPIVFWCQEAFQQVYKDYFTAKGLKIEVKSIEAYLSEFKTEDNTATEIQQIFSKLTHPDRNKIIDCVYLKDLFFNVLLATQGDYVLDTNIQTDLTAPVNFPKYTKFMFPWVSDTSELWMQYAPPDNLSRAKKVLRCYLDLYQNAVKIFNEQGYSAEYHKQEGIIASAAIRLKNCKVINNFMTETCDVWRCGFLKNTEIAVPGFNVHKEYYNSHKENQEYVYKGPHAHAIFGKVDKLEYELNHGIHPDFEANPRCAVEPSLDYDANNETLLHLATRYSHLEGRRNCMKLLLERGADADREYQIISRDVMKTKTPLIYTIESREEDAVKKLFQYARVPIRLDRISNNQTPLMRAIKCGGNGLELLLDKGADPNQLCETEDHRDTPLAMAISRKNPAWVKLLLTKGKANPNTPIKKVSGIVRVAAEPPLHIALKNEDAETVALLLQYGADPFAEAEYHVGNSVCFQKAEIIITSKDCRMLLNTALQIRACKLCN